LHHLVLERWSRGASALHRRDPRAKILALLVLLIALATAGQGLPFLASSLLLLLVAGLRWAGIPVAGALARAALVLPISAMFAAISWLEGDPGRGALLATKSYLSALAVVLVVSTTPLPPLLRACGQLGAPRLLLEIGQFLFRYLFVISEEAQHMTKAAEARGSPRRWASRQRSFRAAAGALAVLFAHSYVRAADIHRAMLSRGFQGSLPLLEPRRFHRGDAIFVSVTMALIVGLRIVAERVAQGYLG
jgi:cobalt/nickel transport system permease protein